ncbi:TA system VapC family ribonuclease toxin [uncultured Jatrophihabitans sp.]|uniref:TA system VapC family ribonuclease toxin n=1 Tax=uncultured Jatrophihabitans sp. TaxID=1610747 RepID=UPI0035CBCAA2
MTAPALLDVNVLIALLDRSHVDHRTARQWLTGHADPSWASCAITQNGYVRVVSQPSYPASVSTSAALALLAAACGTLHHEFWPCDVSLLDAHVVDRGLVLGPKQLTDVYLLALAVRHNGRLVTFDRSIPVAAVAGANPRHLVVL